MEDKVEKKAENRLIHEFTTFQNMFGRNVIIFFVVLLIAGIFSGFFIAQVKNSSSGGKNIGGFISNLKGTTVGSSDTKTFSDTTEGILKEGGFEGEGAYHLERPGGKSQYAYLTSSVIDLSAFVNKKVKVWGKTEKAQKAGWLMDVGRLQIL